MKTISERNKNMFKDIVNGCTYAEVAKKNGISNSRTEAIFNRVKGILAREYKELGQDFRAIIGNGSVHYARRNKAIYLELLKKHGDMRTKMHSDESPDPLGR